MPDTPDTTMNSHFGSRIKMPTFSGGPEDRIELWLNTFNRWCTLNSYDDNQKTSLLPFVFVGSAEKIFNAWDMANAIPATWTGVVTLLKTQFADASRTKIYEANLLKRTLQPGETFETYFADVISLCSAVKATMPESEKIQNLLKGLPENIVQFLLLKDPKTTTDLLNAYSTFKTAKLIASPACEPTPIAAACSPDPTISLSSKFETLFLAQNEKIAELQALIAKQNSDPKCFRCQLPGHIARDCTLPRSPTAGRKNNGDNRSNRHRTPSPARYSGRHRTPSPYRSSHYAHSDSRSRDNYRYSGEQRRPQNHVSPGRFYAPPPSQYGPPPPQFDYAPPPHPQYYQQNPNRSFSSTSPSRYYQSPSNYSEN
jgi:hypothetical protein